MFKILARVIAIATLTFSGCSQARHFTNSEEPHIPSVDVAIVGGGLTGLTTAYALKKVGIDAVVLETKPWLGGRVQTVVLPGGEIVEAHMEEYWERSPAVSLIRELGLEVDSDVAHSSVRLGGKIYPYQGDTKESYLDGMFSPTEKKAFLLWNERMWNRFETLHNTFYSGLPVPPELDRLRNISFASYIKSQKLPPKVSEWIRVTLETEIATEWDTISALDGLDEMRIFLDSPESFGEMCYHVQGGNSRFVRALAGNLSDKQIITSAQVTSIVYDANHVRLRYLHNGENYREIDAKFVVVTPPLHELRRIQFVPPLNSQKQKAIDTTDFGGYIKIHLLLDGDAAPLWHRDGENVLVLLSDSAAGTIYDKTVYDSDGKAKEALLTLLISGKYVTSMLGMSANEMREHAVKNLDKLFPGIAKKVRSAEIFVYPKAVARWSISKHRSRFDSLANELRKPEQTVYIGGDTTESSHSEGAVEAAIRITNSLKAALRKNGDSYEFPDFSAVKPM